jgi:tetratricopeptide (TPR) repeat protein
MPNSIDIHGNNNNTFQGLTNPVINITNNSIAKTSKDLTLRIPKIHLTEVIGRENELEDLHKLLFDNKHVVVVNGLGGIGKTTLAQAYVSLYYDDYQHIAWISQSSGNAIESDFVNADGLKENLKIDTNGKDLLMLFNEVLLGLKTLTDKPNLLLIDNAETSLTQYFDRLPNQPNWHLLVTSRENIERFYIKELGFLSLEKALALFQKHCTLIKDEDAIKELLHIVDYHTLTIEILAKTAQKLRTGISVLKTAIENNLKSPVFINHKGEKIDKVRTYLCSIFDLSKLNENEIWLMKQFACLPSEFHAYELLLELINPAGEHEENFAVTLTELVEKGWLLINIENDTYKMHRVIADVTSQKLAIELGDVENLVISVFNKLSLDQTKDNPVDKFQWIPFGESILNKFEKESVNKIITLQNSLSTLLQESGDYEGAKKHLEKAKISLENNFGEEDSDTINLYSNLANVLIYLGDYEGAFKLLEKIASFEEKTIEDRPDIGRNFENLALIAIGMGNFERAKILLEKTVFLNEKNFENHHPTLAINYSNLAFTLKALGDYREALKLSEKAIIINEINFGENHPKTALSYSSLGLVLQDMGDYAKAKILLEKAKKSDEKNFGKENVNTAVTYSKLALILKDLGDYAEALNLSLKSLEIFQKALPVGHPSINHASRIYNEIIEKFNQS